MLAFGRNFWPCSLLLHVVRLRLYAADCMPQTVCGRLCAAWAHCQKWHTRRKLRPNSNSSAKSTSRRPELISGRFGWFSNQIFAFLAPLLLDAQLSMLRAPILAFWPPFSWNETKQNKEAPKECSSSESRANFCINLGAQSNWFGRAFCFLFILGEDL